jgi:hypothetical protein
MNYTTRSPLNFFWLLIGLTIVFAPGLGGSEANTQATGPRIAENIAPRILAPLSEEAVTRDGRPNVNQVSTEEAVAVLTAGLLGALGAAIRPGQSPRSLEPQTAGSLVSSRGPPYRT